jgi:hypothetical protein
VRVGFSAGAGIAVLVLFQFFPLFPEQNPKSGSALFFAVQWDKRPFVFLMPISLKAKYDSNIFVIAGNYHIVIKGQTPALSVTVEHTCGISNKGGSGDLAPPPVERYIRKPGVPSVLHPGEEIDIGCDLNIHRSQATDWPPDVRSYSIEGVVRYGDMFGLKHESQFCFRDVGLAAENFIDIGNGFKSAANIWFMPCSGQIKLT